MSNSVELLEELVRIYSPSRQEEPAVAFLVEQMRRRGMDAHVDAAGNTIGILGTGKRQIVLLGHIDTFHGQIPVRREDGVLYGRGSVDAKGCLAAFVAACERVGARNGVSFIVVGAVEEESASSKGARYAATQFSPDYCVVGEPSGWDRITLGYKGRVNVDYEFARPMTHGASGTRPATEEAVAFWQQVLNYSNNHNSGKERAVDRLDPSLRSIHSSDDGLTDRVTMRVNVRVPLGMTIEMVEEDIARFANGASLSFSSEEPPFRAEKNNGLVRAFLGAIREEGGKPAFTLKTGTADMNIVGPAWKCPIVAYGPGDSTLDHTPNEHLELAEYEKSIQVLARVLASLTQEEQP